MDRVIFHVDANCFYASVECLYHPELKDQPVAVCGDPNTRHGIILTATYPAKRLGVHVGMAIWQAKQLCPELICIAPSYGLYEHFSQMIRSICSEYSHQVEPFGLDECWVDVSADQRNVIQGGALADELRERIKSELGVTVSIGVADNKVFAKLGSDFRKPDGTTVISPTGFRKQIWPLPVREMLYIGPATERRLHSLGILTIGDLACADTKALKKYFGKNGLLIQTFALGQDRTPVLPSADNVPVKSVGNSTTTPHDIDTVEDAKCIYYLLAESVAARLREQGVRTQCVTISARSADLSWSSCQGSLSIPTNSTDDIAKKAFILFKRQFIYALPLHSAGLCCDALSPADAPLQLDFSAEAAARLKCESLDRAVDDLRRRYGHNIVQRGVVMANSSFAAIKPMEDNLLHPASFIPRREMI